jgi:hypothetical protein
MWSAKAAKKIFPIEKIYKIINLVSQYSIYIIYRRKIFLRKILSLWYVFIIISVTLTGSCFAQNNIIGNAISWTQTEIAFLKENPVIRLGIDPKFVPFEIFDEDGEYKGITADYLSLISEKTGLEFDIIR